MARWRYLLLLSAALLALPIHRASAAGGPPAPSDYSPPVEGEVIDPFRPPAHVGAPGNRGLEYETTRGSEVRAAKDGQVSFAGAVGGTLHVTVAHLDGLRTSYSFLAGISVRKGQFVSKGQVLGTSGESLHFGARMGDSYVDPALLFGRGARRARLVSAGVVRAGNALAVGADQLAWLRPAAPQRESQNSWQAPMRRLIELAVHFRTF